ncbi:MAG: GrpB family protein [Dehalococcoidia bacterium]
MTLVEKYNPAWPQWFDKIKAFLGDKVSRICIRIEHVGSTSIPGMIAKPIIDIVLVIEPERWEDIKSLLEERGYYHQGDKGIPERESFDFVDPAMKKSFLAHNLYVCPKHSDSLKRQTAFRDYLIKHPTDAELLSALKWSLAEKFDNDKYPYMDGKDALCKEITGKALEYFKEES